VQLQVSTFEVFLEPIDFRIAKKASMVSLVILNLIFSMVSVNFVGSFDA